MLASSVYRRSLSAVRLTSSLNANCISCRCFVQGAPPNTGPGNRDGIKRFLRNPDGTVNKNPHESEFQEGYQERIARVQQYYTEREPGKPVPLPENRFEDGKFGMRRRAHIAKDKKFDMKVGDEFAEGSNAFRK
ncbi:hypothetical protein AGDE_07883 [Angomonas deanei]|uniref:Uncharacterized protein n=1 Tax=Angomonas deanei TaxID=59799 RepID=A0A7G2CVB5_9TRYP|nr:hypothetical protein AGDE_07883 [Angomonas deanei]CAD2222252.1 hypothetical protein, conserved [Angomonas deanei]|eukprot:EPY34500.1 hypothetical protein AGDE_07883 [Angomonas deanei]